MCSRRLGDLLEKIASAQILTDPFDHVIIDDFLPRDLYGDMIQHRIGNECLQTLQELNRIDYHTQRRVIGLGQNMPILDPSHRALWESMHALMDRVALALLEKFCWFRSMPCASETSTEIFFVRDNQGYRINPHTDAPTKLCTALLYLPQTRDLPIPGTTLYRPHDPRFICEGGPHYQNLWDFEKIRTVEYQPNRLLAFRKTNRSFHGVEEMTSDLDRDLLISDVRNYANRTPA